VQTFPGQGAPPGPAARSGAGTQEGGLPSGWAASRCRAPRRRPEQAAARPRPALCLFIHPTKNNERGRQASGRGTK